MLESLGIEPSRDGSYQHHPLLDLMPATADELVRATGRSAGEIATALAELELAGLAAEGEGIYRRAV